MSDTARDTMAAIPVGRRHYIGIFLLSFATLLLELALTRVLSVALWYHFGFLIISTALLGFGATGVTLSVWTHLRERAMLDRALAAVSLSFGLTTIASFWLMQRIPFDPFGKAADWKQIFFMPLYYLDLTAPFFCSGLAIALLFTRRPNEVDRLYAADLLGAGSGCALLTAVMPVFGGAGSVVVAAAIGLLAAAVFGIVRVRALALTALVLAVLALPLALFSERALPISVAPSKQHPLLPHTPSASRLLTQWNGSSRVDVYDLEARPEEGWPHSGTSLVIDGGTAATGLGDMSEGVRNYLQRRLDYRPRGLAYVGKAHPKVLIIGSGAGAEVLEALYFGASSITAVEINSCINDIVSRRLRSHWGGLFEQPEVQLVTDEGRSFVRRSTERYDIIISVQTVTNAALASGALSLAENYVFTIEAFEEYLDRLTPDGVLLITRGADQVARLFATVREVFERRGLGSPANNLVAFRGRFLPWGPRLRLTGFLFKKSPLTPEELQTIEKRLGVGEAEREIESKDSPAIMYSPLHRHPESIYNSLLTTPDLRTFYRQQALDFSPVTDDRPFFNQQTRWSNIRPGSWRQGGMSPGAEGVLLMLLVQSVAVAGVFILLPLARFSRQGLRAPGRWAYLVYFAGLGLGFIMIEVALLQRFTLFLGQPIYTLAVVLASLLMFGGIGSYAVARFSSPSRPRFRLIILAVLTVIVVTAYGTHSIFSATLGWSLASRIAVAILMIAPLGIFLGMPFPACLRLVAEQAPVLVPWAWGVNGFFTVIGSAAAMILGMIWGFSAVLACAGGCYLVALLAITLRRSK
jgi:hypothetical protein